MARYIDVDLEVSDYVTVWDCDCSEFGKQTVIAVDDLQYLPTADVVPKSEVDRLNAVMKDMDEQRAYTINMLGENLENAKSDVERLQAEIETLKDNNEHLAVLLEEAKQAYANYEETTGLKQAKQEVAMDILAKIAEIADQLMNSPYYSIGDAIHDIAELTKEYTEEKT